jgi:hypothetical protein
LPAQAFQGQERLDHQRQIRRQAQAVPAQQRSHVGEHRAHPQLFQRHAAIAIDALDVIEQGYASARIEPHVDDVSLGRCDDDARHERLARDQPDVTTNELEASTGNREVEYPGARGVGEKESHDVAALNAQCVLR